jgi:hypothetical protein
MEPIEFGTFAVDKATRRVRGILVPWGEKSRTSASKTKPITFPRGSVTIPRDPAVVTLNVGHDRFSPLGRGARFEDREAGLHAEFDIADTEEGDQWLEDHGKFVKLSAEVRDIVRDANDHGKAKLTGAALVTEGAFASAALFAIDEDEETKPDEEPDEEATEEESPSEDDENPDEEPDEEEKEDDMAEATAPDTMLAGRAKVTQPELTARGLFAAVSKARTVGDNTDLLPYHRAASEMGLFDDQGLFALSDVKFNLTGGLNINDQLTGPRYLGELWAGRTFDRTFIPLITHDTLTSLNATGWVWNVKPSMATWAGNKAAITSNAPTVTPSTYAAQRYAGGHDLAREFYDFNVTDVIESYVRAMVDSYAVLSDGYALTQALAGATAVTLGAVAGTQSKAVNAIVDLASAVAAARATPSFALVGTSVYRDIFTTQQTGSYAYVEGEIGLSSGRVAGIPVYLDARLAAGQVLVGAKEAVTAWELPGSPIRVQAADLVNGGIDNAFFGYIAAGVTFPTGLAKATITYP